MVPRERPAGTCRAARVARAGSTWRRAAAMPDDGSMNPAQPRSRRERDHRRRTPARRPRARRRRRGQSVGPGRRSRSSSRRRADARTSSRRTTWSSSRPTRRRHRSTPIDPICGRPRTSGSIERSTRRGQTWRGRPRPSAQLAGADAGRPDPRSGALPETELLIPRLPFVPLMAMGSPELARGHRRAAWPTGGAPGRSAVLLERHGAVAVGATPRRRPSIGSSSSTCSAGSGGDALLLGLSTPTTRASGRPPALDSSSSARGLRRPPTARRTTSPAVEPWTISVNRTIPKVISWRSVRSGTRDRQRQRHRHRDGAAQAGPEQDVEPADRDARARRPATGRSRAPTPSRT